MADVYVGGVWVPQAIASHFRSSALIPFSYTRPNLKMLPKKIDEVEEEAVEDVEPKPMAEEQKEAVGDIEAQPRTEEQKEGTPRVMASPLLVTERGMAQPVHLQYNSPMPIYSKETAEEQFQQQIGQTTSPIPLPVVDKHFDPEKSATLKLIKEGDEGHFGEHFFEQIANVEAPKAFSKEEPEWARYAREKSERARSRTPADPSQHHTPSTTPTHAMYYQQQHQERPRADSPHEFIEKAKTYTHTLQPRYGPAYYQVQPQSRRRGYSEPREVPGYEYGGLDFTKGLHFPAAPPDYSYETRSRRSQHEQRPRSGYELGGVAYTKGYVSTGGPYHGHGPDPPRLRSRYSADPKSPCNTYYAPNVDEVDANLLVGDTISNQKIRHEVRHINQNEFGTSFAPPTGFKRDHITVRRSPAPPEPVTFTSMSANRARYGSTGNLSSSRPYQQQQQYHQHQEDVWRRDQSANGVGVEKEVTVKTLLTDEALRRVDRETTPTWRDRSLSKHEAWKHRSDPRLDRDQVFVNEPNWSRTVQERRNAWERMAYDTDARVSLPASAKVPVAPPPAWHNKAARTHNVWQQAADTMSQGATQSYIQQPQHTFETSQTSYHHSDSGAQPYQSQYHEERQSQHQEQQQRRHESQQQQYITSAPVQGYSSSQHSESHTAKSVPPQQTIVNGNNAELQLNTGYNVNQVEYLKDHFDKYRAGPKYNPATQYEQMNQSSYSKTYSSSAQQESVAQQQAAPIALPAPGQSYSYSTETRSSSQAVPVSSSYQQQYNQSTSLTNGTSKAVPVVPEKSSFEESSYHRSESSKQETSRAIPLQTASSAQESQTKSYISNAQAMPIAQTPAQNYSASSYTETHSTQPPVVMHSPGGSYKSYSSSHYSKQEKTTSTTTNQQPAPALTYITNQPITKSTSYNYQQQSVPSAPAPVQMSQSSFTSHTEKSSTAAAPQPTPATRNYEAHMSRHREETHREETSRPVSQLSQYSEQKHYKRNLEEKTETRTIPAATTVYTSDSNRNFSAQDVFNKKEEMSETLPHGSISNTHANAQGGYRDQQGHDVSYKRETQTAVDPGKEYALLKEEEKRVVETDLEPGVISRHVTTKYYKKKTVTDTTTTTTPQ